MDHFGIGTAVLGAVETYITGARRTGRTTSLLESLKTGDRVVCRTQGEANDLDIRCRERGLTVSFIVMPVIDPSGLFSRGPTSEGRTLFDHTWLEDYYRKLLREAVKDIDHVQRETSGFGTAHLETKRQALEAARWRP